MTTKIIVPHTLIHQHEDGSKDTYIRHEELGRGGFAAVYRVTHKESGRDFALKAIARDRYVKPKSLEKLKSEIMIQKSLDHPNILKSYKNFSDSCNYYIIIELCPGQSVRDLVRRSGYLSEKETARILHDVVSGLVYLHDNRIIHRDLKLENFLIGSDGRVKIADFGLSTKLDYDDERKYTVCGTPNYLSPELLTQAYKGHSYEVDIWTIGVSAFAMLTGHPPFETMRTKLTYEHIKNCQYHFPSDISISQTAKDFIRIILRIKPERRPNACDLLMHPFLANYKPRKEKVIVHKEIPRDIFRARKPIYGYKEYPKAKGMKRDYLNNKQNENLKKDDNNNDAKNGAKNDDKNKIPIQNDNKVETIQKDNSKNEEAEKKPVLKQKNDNKIISNPKNKETEEIDIAILPKHCVARFCNHNKALGYLLMDGTVGACFNDLSRMIMDPFETFIQYYDSYDVTSPEILDLQSETEKWKISILRRFSNSLKKTRSLFELPQQKYESSTPLHHVKYWMNNDDATLFRLDDRNIQVNFNDHLKLVIFWNTKKMTIINSIKENGKLLSLNEVSCMNPSTNENKRFMIAKAMLAELSGR
ncbi:CAMK family protein kinase [Tritrichomonas foetus]|uniref:CAMK family protein kinase n=1 Tax=Tritrichomonas foetus TaxID=1144522 RepID=A0A1J4K8G3_9EUKA|nr:CAMK family protein kinase [Tritrichomonas foetus]|eukprot:OHT07499.1 CAMK family protein kinase [Tritrichomonas foetus]